MSELVTDTGGAAPAGTVLMHLCERLWSAEHDISGISRAIGEYSIEGTVRQAIDDFHAEGTYVMRPEQHRVIGQKAYTAYLAQEGAKEDLSTAKYRRDEIREELRDFSSTLIGEKVTVESLDEAPRIRLERDVYGVKWLKRVRGTLSNPALILGIGGELEVTPGGLYGKIRGGIYRFQPIDENGRPRVKLTFTDN